ncbi:MAG: LamG domain-containing protein [Desulfobacterales bacterium]|nr:LamG domain-containing protein [Desulfobacterales bacterium]
MIRSLMFLVILLMLIPFHALSNDLILHWQLDEITGNTAENAPGVTYPELNGEIFNGTRIAGPMSGAISFDGSNSYIETESVEELDVESFSTSMWLNSKNGTRTCAYLRLDGRWHLRTSGGQWDIKFEGGDEVYSNYFFPPEDNDEWHYYTITIDNTNKKVTFYVDGVEEESRSFVNGPSQSNTRGAFYVGQYDAGFRWKGGVDDVKFYQGVLSSDEVKNEYRVQRKLNPDLLAGHWKFNETSAVSHTEDVSIISNPGTVNGTQIIEGVEAGAFLFNGISDFIEITKDPVYETQNFTSSVWLKNPDTTNTCAYMRKIGSWHIRTYGGQWDLRLEGTSSTINSGYSFPSDDKWHLYTITVDSDKNSVDFYVDGEKYGNSHVYTGDILQATAGMYIGQYSENFSWTGGIDDARYYLKALSAEDIKKLYDEKVASPVDVGLSWAFMGDSQTTGQAVDTPDVLSSAVAVDNIWKSIYPDQQATLDNRGWGSHSLYMSWKDGWHKCYNAIEPKDTLSWVHFQESGSFVRSDRDSHQTTLEDYKATLDGFINDIRLGSPNAVISTETAFSYGRTYPDWTEYNAHLRAKVAELKSQNVNIILIDIDKLIKYAQSSEGFGDPHLLWYFPGDAVPYHYTGLGNYIIALAIYDGLGFDISNWDEALSNDLISKVPNDQISSAQKTKCIEIVKNYLN